MRTRLINERGLGLVGGAQEKLRDIRVYDESGCVQVWVEVMDNSGGTREALQYLSPTEAMAFAKAFERCAIQALRYSA